MNISIETIDHKLQRYDTVGDWAFEVLKHVSVGGKEIEDLEELKINVSEMDNLDYEFLVTIHELIEAYLCKRAGITTEMVDAWDMNYIGSGEPGNHVMAPYYAQHIVASLIERMLAFHMTIDWESYERVINSLGK